MSTDVHLQLIRRSDCQPGLRWYIGGPRLWRELASHIDFEHVDDGYLAKAITADQLTELSSDAPDQFDLAHVDEVLSQLEGKEGDYVLWLLVES